MVMSPRFFHQLIAPDGYEPKLLSSANRTKESCLTFAIEQEEDTAVNFYRQTSLALRTKDGLSEQPSHYRVQKSSLKEEIQQKRYLALLIPNRLSEQQAEADPLSPSVQFFYLS